MTELILIYALAFALSVPVGWYLARIHDHGAAPLDRVFHPMESVLYRLAGVTPERAMRWQDYGRAFMGLHVVLGLLVFALLVAQGGLPLNPDGVPGMSWDLALHTAVSFLTNTNQQHYSGQAQLSYLAQTLGIVSLQLITPTAGMCALVAILRGLFGLGRARNGETAGLGNFHVDLIRGLLRFTLPAAAVVAVLLAWQGVPSTYQGAQVATPLDTSAGQVDQRIPLGPVAAMVAIKQIGTNGGGWYGPNSSVPLENPTPVSNLVETIAIVVWPVALVVMLGFLTGRRRLVLGILTVMVTMSAGLTGLAVWSENQPNPAFEGLAAVGPNLEGKEVRFGATASALWGSLTTQTSNGSVNAMHDSFNPGGGVATLMGMFINATFGGVGVGLINYLLYFLLAAFLGSLMVGRAPGFLGRSLEAREMKLVCLALLLPTVVILGFSAITAAYPLVANTSNPGAHGLSQVLYEYTSAFANNGSGFEGLGDDTVWWNLSTAICLIVGRFIPILAPLAVAGYLADKRPAPASRGSLDVEAPVLAVLTLGVILILALLSFMPVLVLGPIAEALAGA